MTGGSRHARHDVAGLVRVKGVGTPDPTCWDIDFLILDQILNIIQVDLVLQLRHFANIRGVNDLEFCGRVTIIHRLRERCGTIEHELR